MKSLLRSIAMGTGLAVGAAAHAQWTATNLHPAGATYSRAHGVSGGQQVGTAGIGGQYHASLWLGSAGSRIDLHPAGATSSEVWDVDSGHQVGYAKIGTIPHASLWAGDAASWIDLHPANAANSTAYGVSDDQQVGSVGIGGGLHAALWTGGANSFLDLHPTAKPPAMPWKISEAYGTRDGKQYGYAGTFPASIRGFQACMWSGSVASWTSLDLPAALSVQPGSMIDSANHGQQVGYTGTPSLNHSPLRAILWQGTSESAVDLTPTGASAAWAQGVCRGQQVGYFQMSNSPTHACLWSGTAASCVDLHAFLPTDFTSSNARGIWSNSSYTYVVGWGSNNTTKRTEALLWTRRTCGADFTHNELVDDADFTLFIVAYDALVCPDAPAFCPADLNDDGVVDDADFSLFVVAYDELMCP